VLITSQFDDLRCAVPSRNRTHEGIHMHSTFFNRKTIIAVTRYVCDIRPSGSACLESARKQHNKKYSHDSFSFLLFVRELLCMPL